MSSSLSTSRRLAVLFSLGALLTLPGACLGREEDRKDAARALRILSRLAPLADESTYLNFSEYGARAGDLLPGARVKIAELREGELRKYLATAADYYLAASRAQGRAGRAPACSLELRPVFVKLCRRVSPPDRSRLLWEKARLNARWAEALASSRGGPVGAETLAALVELEAARGDEERLAALAAGALRRLAGMVNAYETLWQFEEGRSLASVPFERFAAELREVLSEINPALDALPRGRLYYLLAGARDAFRDGAFWWEKVHASRAGSLVVSAREFRAADPLAAMSLNRPTAAYTVVCNWRQGVKRLREAERALHLDAPDGQARR